MKKFLLVIFLTTFTLTFSQKKSIKSKGNSTELLNCYLPTGEKCTPEQSISDIELNVVKKFEDQGRAWSLSADDDTIIFYKSLTKTPLFILFMNNNKYSSDKVKDIINGINEENSGFNYYFGTIVGGEKYVGFKSDLKRGIKKKIIDKNFILETLGIPLEKKESLYDGKPVECFIYPNMRIRIYFVDDVAIAFDEY